jgi:hypothetical protein
MDGMPSFGVLAAVVGLGLVAVLTDHFAFVGGVKSTPNRAS